MKERILELMYNIEQGNINYKYASAQVDDLFSVLQQSEQLFCYHGGSYTLTKGGVCCKCHRPPKPIVK
jgi:hypothetical protein